MLQMNQILSDGIYEKYNKFRHLLRMKKVKGRKKILEKNENEQLKLF